VKRKFNFQKNNLLVIILFKNISKDLFYCSCKRRILITAFICFCLSIAFSNNVISLEKNYTNDKNSYRIPMHFIENNGQMKDTDGNFRNEILFLLKSDNIRFYFFKNQMSVVLIEYEEGKLNNKTEPPTSKMFRYDIEFVGSKAKRVFGEDLDVGKHNYYTPKGPVTNISTYNKIIYEDIYPNIDLIFYINDKGLKYDFIVRSVGNPHDIKMEYIGAEISMDNKRNINISTPLGNLKEGLPQAYQFANSNQSEIECSYKLNDNIVSFDFGDYDKSEELIIDPVLYFYVFAEGSDDEISSIQINQTYQTNGSGYLYGGGALDIHEENGDNCQYITGSTLSEDFLTAPYQTLFSSNWDIFAMKYNSNNGHVWTSSVVIQGEDIDLGADISVSGDDVYILGTTYSYGLSTSLPIPGSAYQTSMISAPDMIILRFNPTLGSLLWSTFFGNDDIDIAHRIEANTTSEKVVVFGESASTNFLFQNAFQPNMQGVCDAIIGCFTPNLNTLNWGTYYGGSLQDNGLGLDVDFTYNKVYLTGATMSYDFPTTSYPTPFQQYISGTLFPKDAFIGIFNLNDGTLLYSSYFGGLDEDFGQGIVKSDNHIAITGFTKSDVQNDGFPIFNNSIDLLNSDYDAGENYDMGDCFVAYFDALNINNLYSSYYIGGKNIDRGNDIVSDGLHYYLTGMTKSVDFPLLMESQPHLNLNNTDDYFDAFIVKLATPHTLIYSSYFGGTGDDYGIGIDYYINTSSNEISIVGNTDEYSEFIDCDEALHDGVSYCEKHGGKEVFISTFGDENGWPTYFGGSNYDFVEDLYIDIHGYVYITGKTMSSDFPNTPGVIIDPTPLNNVTDIFVAKFTPEGILVFSLNCGGINGGGFIGWDGGKAIYSKDKNSDIYVTGYTASLNLGAYESPHISYQSSLAGFMDAFLMKISPDGETIRFFTYYGSVPGNESGEGLAVDDNGNAYITGYAYQTISGLSGYQTTYGGNTNDVFVAKFSPTGNLLASTYLGGSLDETGTDIVLSRQGVALTGFTTSTNFPVTNTGTEQTSLLGQTDAFFSVLSNDLNNLVYSTYIGGIEKDTATGIDYYYDQYFDKFYICGFTQSPNQNYTFFPSPYNLKTATDWDGFISRIFYYNNNWAANASLYIRQSSSNDEQKLYDIKVDSENDKVYAIGKTAGGDILNDFNPTPTLQSYESNYDALIVKMNSLLTPNLNDLYYTFLGGTNNDEGLSIGLFPNNNILTSLNTDSPMFVPIFDAVKNIEYSSTLIGNKDVFLSKINNNMNAFLKQPIHSNYIDFDRYSFSIYPNPTQNILYVKLNFEIDSNPLITIQDVIGNYIEINISKDVFCENEFIVDVSRFNTGIYLINIQTEKGNFFRKFIVKK
jgi:hypothetical protein